MAVTEFAPVIDPLAVVGAGAGLAVGVAALAIDTEARLRRRRCALQMSAVA